MKSECRKLKANYDGNKKDQFKGNKDSNEKENTAEVASDGEVFITYDDGFVNFTS